MPRFTCLTARMAYFFTKENARQMQALGASARTSKTTAKLIVENEAEQAETFRIQRLARVRVQLVRLDKQLADETDPARLDRLMSALNRLQEAEGWLAGRAKPGNKKPAPDRKPRSGAPAPLPEPEDG